MSYPVPVQVVLTRALQKANLEGHDEFLTPAEQIDAFNVSFAEWYDLVRLTTWGGQYYRAPAFVFATASGQTVYALPADFLAMLSVDIFLSSTWKVCGRPFQEEERNVFTGPSLPVGWTYGLPIWYQLQGGNIVFLANPASIYTIGLNYVPTAPQYTQPNESFDSINGWEEWIVIDMAMKFLFKAGLLETRAALAPDLVRQNDRIVAAAPNRDMGAAEVVHDVTGIEGDMAGLGGLW